MDEEDVCLWEAMNDQDSGDICVPDEDNETRTKQTDSKHSSHSWNFNQSGNGKQCGNFDLSGNANQSMEATHSTGYVPSPNNHLLDLGATNHSRGYGSSPNIPRQELGANPSRKQRNVAVRGIDNVCRASNYSDEPEELMAQGRDLAYETALVVNTRLSTLPEALQLKYAAAVLHMIQQQIPKLM